MNKRVLILGDGLLGKEIHNQTNWPIISRSKHNFDLRLSKNWDAHLLNNFEGIMFSSKYDIIVNCMAHTDTYSSKKKLHWETNVQGVKNLIDFCNKWSIKLVHISTDYAYAGNKLKTPTENDVPIHAENWYSYTKVLGDAIIELLSNSYLICRATHKPSPFPFKKAFTDRRGNFDYTPKIASLLIKLISNHAEGIFNVGTESKTIFELAKQTNNTVIPTTLPPELPKDTSMDLSKLNKFLNTIK